MNHPGNAPKLYFIAHRMNVGSPTNDCYNHVDNGMEALDAVVRIAGANNDTGLIKGFECDVRLTCDNKLVIIHDANTKTMTINKLNRNVGEMTYEALRRVEIRNSGLYYKGLRNRAFFLPDAKRVRRIIGQRLCGCTEVPEANDMFEHLVANAYKGEIVLELKETADRSRDAVVELVNAYKDRLNIVVKSYNEQQTLYIGEKTGVKIGLLEAVRLVNQRKPIDAEYIKTMPFDFYSILWTKVGTKILNALIEGEKDLYMWTIDSAAHMFGAMRKLSSHYAKFGQLPASTHFITNIPILLEEYATLDEHTNPMMRGIKRSYDNLYASPGLILDEVPNG